MGYAYAGALPHGALWQPDHSLHELGTLGPGYSVARGINSQGDVVGYSEVNSRHFGTQWSAGGIRALPSRRRNIFAYSINDRGDVVGNWLGAHGHQYAVCWTNARLFDLPNLLPRFLGGGGANAINNVGLIGGNSAGPGIDMATVWRGRRPFALGNLHTDERERYGFGTRRLGSAVYGMNDRGQIAGWATADDGQTWAVVWNPRDLQP